MWWNDTHIDELDNICDNCESDKLSKSDGKIFCEMCMTVQEKTDINLSSYDEDALFNAKNILFRKYRATPSIFIRTKIPKSFSVIRTFDWSKISHQERKIQNVYQELQEILSKTTINNIDLREEHIVIEVTQYFQMINSYINFRHPITTGIYAICLYYVMKNRRIILTDPELISIFSINKKILSTSNRKVNNVLLRQTRLQKKFNISPLQPSSFIETIHHKFPQLGPYIELIERTLLRLDGHNISIRNVPKSVVSGVVYNYICHASREEGLVIDSNEQKKDIIKKLDVSNSIIDIYQQKTQYYIYDQDNEKITNI